MTTTATNADTGTDTTTDSTDDTSTDTGTTTTTSAPTTDAGTDTGTDTAAEVAKWKALARKHEQESKANKKAREELDAINAAAMSEQEKAVKKAADDARIEARTATLKEVGGKLATAAIRVAASERMAKKQLDRVAPKADDTDKPRPPRDLGGGPRGGQPPATESTQLETDLKTALGI
jgi:hypothetical protein